MCFRDGINMDLDNSIAYVIYPIYSKVAILTMNSDSIFREYLLDVLSYLLVKR